MARHPWIGLATAACLATAAPAGADAPPAFAFPVDCLYGEDCLIQNYVDHDPGPGRIDYACGRLSYDGHDGTDIRLMREVDIERHVLVLAAADGVVLRTRDEMIDLSVDAQPPGAVAGREAGNGVVVDHGGGWVTQYSHLRLDSLRVAPGDRVRRGQPLGAIGLSGLTEFPHVEFTIRYDGTPVDPFVGVVEAGFACGQPRRPLWQPADAARLDYRATAGLAAGFTDVRPDAAPARAGDYDAPALPADAAVLVFWADVMGAMAGDSQHFVISGPDGQPILEDETILETSYVSWFAFAGRRRPDAGWPAGTYRARYTLARDGEVVAELIRAIDLR